MKAVFTVGGDDSNLNEQRSYELAILFNGMPGKVVLEAARLSWPTTDGVGDVGRDTVMRVVLEASHARAISSALLSAATEAKA